MIDIGILAPLAVRHQSLGQGEVADVVEAVIGQIPQGIVQRQAVGNLVGLHCADAVIKLQDLR